MKVWGGVTPDSDGNILYNVICNKNPNHDTKKDLKSKSCFENTFQIKIESQRISQIQNTKSFSLTPSMQVLLLAVIKLWLLSKCSS